MGRAGICCKPITGTHTFSNKKKKIERSQATLRDDRRHNEIGVEMLPLRSFLMAIHNAVICAGMKGCDNG